MSKKLRSVAQLVRAPVDYGSYRCHNSNHKPSTEDKSREIASSKGGKDGKVYVKKHTGGRGFESQPLRPIKPFQIRWNEPLGHVGKPYMRRWILNLKWFSVRVHVWYDSDDERFMHNHAFNFLTIVLKGGYTDVSTNGKDKMTAGSIRYRPANHTHYVFKPNHGTMTLLFCGPKIQNWGFLVNNKIMRPLRFFSRYGHQ